MLRKNSYIALYCLIPLFTFSQWNQKVGDLKRVYTRISGGTALSFYSNNNNHSANTRPGAAFYGNVSEEVRIYKDIFFVGGLEYQHSTMAFNSYYFYPGALNLYNGHYDYNYNLKLQEGRLDLLLRLTGGTELRNQFTAFAEAGYVLRYMINANMKVIDDATGEKLFSGITHPDFIGQKLHDKFSSGLKINIGMQRNFLRTHHALFIQIGLMIGLAQFSVNESFTPASLNIKSTYAQLGLGYKF